MIVMKKDPGDVLDYGIDYSKWLPSTDSIETSTWTVTPSDVSVVSDTISGGKKTAVFLSGGMLAQSYQVMNEICTLEGRTKQTTFWLKIETQ